MTYAITEAQDADAAYMPIWGPLLQFNEQAVGDASALPFALEIRDAGWRWWAASGRCRCGARSISP